MDFIQFVRVHEPKEQAFSILVPKGWIIEGGIFRVNPLNQSGATQAIEAKLDMIVKSDNTGKIMMRWLPDLYFYDVMRSANAAYMANMFPYGSQYNGMSVQPLPYPQDFIIKMVIPYSHPAITELKIIDKKELPALAEAVRKEDYFAAQLGFSYYGGYVVVNYKENNQTYEELIVCVINYFGQMGDGLWKNRYTFFVRTPLGDGKKWEAVISQITKSIIINTKWLHGEIQGQITRGQIAAKTQADIQRIENEIMQNRQKTNSEIQKGMYMTLNDQQEFKNPYTGNVEIGSNQWKQRWIKEDGSIIYSNNVNYNPNFDPKLNQTGYKLSPAVK